MDGLTTRPPTGRKPSPTRGKTMTMMMTEETKSALFAADTDEEVRAIIEALQKPRKRKRRVKGFKAFQRTLERTDHPEHFSSLELLVRGS